MDPSHRESAQLCSGSSHGRPSSVCQCPGLPARKGCCEGLKISLAAMCFVYFAKALSGSYLKSTITQIERRFEIPSSLVGIIDGSFEMGNLLVIMLVSFFGAKLHRPRLIGAGCLLMSLGTFLIALPHFIMGRYIYEGTPTHPSNSTITVPPCLRDYKDQKLYSAIYKSRTNTDRGCDKDIVSAMWLCVLLGNLLRGVGEAPIQPLGISYIDDYAGEDNAAFYIGCIQTAAVIGPIFGFLLGSLCASLFVDVGFANLDRMPITPQDSRWVGAWWLGYLVAGAISVLATIPFWFLPKEQPRLDLRKNSSTPSEQSKFILEDLKASKTEGTLLSMSKDFLPSLKDLLGNPVFLLYLCGSIFQYNSLVGMVTYKPKYIEQQYGQTSTRTNFIIGLINIPAVALGIFSGGLVMKKFHINILGAAKLLLISSVIGYMILMSLFALGCELSPVAGLTVSYEGSTEISSQESAISQCNFQCLCPKNQWEPVCGDNGVTYYSACYAGCRLSNRTGNTAVYYNCSCVMQPSSGSRGGSAMAGSCSKGRHCSRMFLYFMAISVVTSFTLSLGGTPGYILLLRCIKPELKSLALGIYTMAIRVLAGVPAPMYLGALIDSTCLKWGSRSCNTRGFCRLYNTDRFRFIYLGVTVSLGAGFIFFCSAILLMLRKRCLSEESHAPCVGCKDSPTPSNLGGNGHLLQSTYWAQKETRL
ncbi:PREDICTED: solute carrier organic anion transporter family member 1C1-like [Nanorana parkeri]|uniref:solute carrier organic anion transporter family member 1C1-like n=1 Tax=Nanorana parkeri TaxID=125878 RepID=UPI000854BAD2|nr:PREDICTED: solute carrier organic anion transporter family member 1C1-like [Nanorana parkeri]